MKKLFAVPTVDGKLCQHFGHCEKFAIVEAHDDRVVREEYITPPVHQPGVYPKLLADNGVKVIIAAEGTRSFYTKRYRSLCWCEF